MTALWSPLRARPPSGLEPFPNPRRSAPEALPSGPGWSNPPGTVSLELPTAEPPSDRPQSRRNPGAARPATYRPARGLPAQGPGASPAHPAPRRQRSSSRPASPQEAPPPSSPYSLLGSREASLTVLPLSLGRRDAHQKDAPPSPSPGRRLVEI